MSKGILLVISRSLYDEPHHQESLLSEKKKRNGERKQEAEEEQRNGLLISKDVCGLGVEWLEVGPPHSM